MNYLLTTIVATAILIVALVATFAEFSDASFECEKVWTQPDANNDMVKCVTDTNHLYTLIRDPVRMQYGGAIILCILVLAFTIVCCPFITCCRYVCRCFGSYRRRPGSFYGKDEWDGEEEVTKQNAYLEYNKCRLAVLWLPLIILLLCIAPMTLLLDGADTLKQAYHGAFSDVAGLGNWMDNKMNDTRTAMSLENGSLMWPLKESYFESGRNLTSDLRANLKSKEADFLPYVELVRTVAIAIGCAPLVLFIINLLFAIFRCRKCGPLINTFFLMLIVILYGIVGMILLSISLFMRDGCSEIDVYVNGRKPGIMAWYVAPKCKTTLPFDSFKDTIDGMEKEYSVKSCDFLTQVCNGTSDQWTFHKPTTIFYCPGLTNGTSQCKSFNNVTHYVNNTALMSSQLGGGCANDPCTFRECAKTCNQTAIKDKSAAVISNMELAQKAFNAFNNHVRPLLDCDVVMTQALTALASCSTLQLALWNIGSGCFIFELLAAASIVVCWVGQKRWFSLEEDAEAPAESSKNEPTH